MNNGGNMNLGIVGTGLIVNELLPQLEHIPGITCSALCGTEKSKDKVDELCATYHILIGVTDYQELLATDIDTVYVAVPNHLHYQYCLDALRANKNVIVEKPITSNLAEAEVLAGLARDRNLFFFEAITTQYLGNYKKIKELLPQIGEIKLIQCNFSQYSSRYDAFRKGEILPVFDPAKSGGALMDLNLYNVHYVIGLLGAPEQVEYYANVERGIDTSGVLMMKYSDSKAVCIAGKDCGAPSRCVIQGTKGYLLQDTQSSICGAVTLHYNDGTELHFDENVEYHRMVSEFTEFEKQISSGDRTACYHMLDISLTVTKALYEARLSAEIHFQADDIVLK